MSGRIFLASLLLCALLLAPCGSASARDYPATVVRVLDGDTVEVRVDLGFNLSLQESVRLVGLDAPELPTPSGLVTKAWLQGILPAGTPVKVSTGTRERDKYGRILATIYKGPESLNALILKLGLAKEMK